MKICHANIHRLKAEIKFLFAKTELAGKRNIVALSETWLRNMDKSRDFKISGYQLPLHRDWALG